MKTKGMGIALLSTAALLGSAVAMAAEPQWTYGQAGYYRADGPESIETDAYQLTGSIGFAQKWHAQLTWLDGEIDVDGAEGGTADFDGYRLVVGAHPAISANTQLVTDFFYSDVDVEDLDNTAYGAGIGLRSNIVDRVELLGQIWWVNGELDGSDIGFSSEDYTDFVLEVGGRYSWTPNFSTGIKLTLNDSIAGIGIGGGGGGSLGGISTGDSAVFDVRWTFGGDVF